MPPTRSTPRSRSSAPLDDSVKYTDDKLAIIPPLGSLQERLEWACNLRRAPLSSVMAVLDEASASSGRSRCLVCFENFNANPKTLNRHNETYIHLEVVARKLRVNLDSLRPMGIPCKHCKTPIGGELRKDSLKRHEENCKNNPLRVGMLKRAASLPHVRQRSSKKVPTPRRLPARSASMPNTLAQLQSSTAHSRNSRKSRPTATGNNRQLPRQSQPSSLVHESGTTMSPALDETAVTRVHRGLSGMHTVPPGSLEASLSALHQPLTAIPHRMQYEVPPPSFSGPDPLFQLGPAAVGFDLDYEPLSANPLGWDWLIEQDLLL